MTASAKPLYFSTKVPASQTAQECMALLAKHGAMEATISWGSDREPTGLRFTIEGALGPLQYSLPVKVNATSKRLTRAYRDGKIPLRYAGPDQARKVAWRVLLGWLTAQVEFIELGVAELPEVMLPWMHTQGGQTVWTAYQESQQRELEASRG